MLLLRKEKKMCVRNQRKLKSKKVIGYKVVQKKYGLTGPFYITQYTDDIVEDGSAPSHPSDNYRVEYDKTHLGYWSAYKHKEDAIGLICKTLDQVLLKVAFSGEIKSGVKRGRFFTKEKRCYLGRKIRIIEEKK